MVLSQGTSPSHRRYVELKLAKELTPEAMARTFGLVSQAHRGHDDHGPDVGTAEAGDGDEASGCSGAAFFVAEQVHTTQDKRKTRKTERGCGCLRGLTTAGHASSCDLPYYFL